MDYNLLVGYDGKMDTLKKVLATSEKISDVYTGGLKNLINSGRYQYAESVSSLVEQINYVHSKGATYSVTLNAVAGVPPKKDTLWWEEISDYLKKLEFIGVDNIILSHPFLMELAKSKTSLNVMTSTMCEINNTRTALYYEGFGADYLCPSVSINNDLKELRQMKNALKNSKLKLLVNEYCLGGCPYRRFHQNNLSQPIGDGQDIDYALSCTSIYQDSPHLFLTNNTIRPEDLINYKDISSDFKLVGRTIKSDTLLLMIKAYSQGFYNGNYIDLINNHFSDKVNIPNEKLTELFTKKSKCKNYCHQCNYCETLFNKVAETSF
ncbi:U32 family peptidase [Enterococcus sp. UD-01]|jgi:collagenase-like PrtC family protease|uniref:U32 family peptidase n=1 Tax=Enterococcus sp. UD-01 TaxID=3373911 RepID=UPI0038336AD6